MLKAQTFYSEVYNVRFNFKAIVSLLSGLCCLFTYPSLLKFSVNLNHSSDFGATGVECRRC